MVSFKVHFLFRDFSIYMYDFRHCIMVAIVLFIGYMVYLHESHFEK